MQQLFWPRGHIGGKQRKSLRIFMQSSHRALARCRYSGCMEQSPEPGRSSFFESIAAQHADRTERSKQLCRDFHDFCESVGNSTAELQAAYEALPSAVGLKATLDPVHEVVRKLGNNSREVLPVISEFLRDMETPTGRFTGELALQSNLRTMPVYLEQAERMNALLAQSVEIAKGRNQQGPQNEKLACLRWIAAVEPVRVALDYEINALRSSLALAQGPESGTGRQ